MGALSYHKLPTRLVFLQGCADNHYIGDNMVSNGWVRDGKSGWQRAHDSVVHLCRHRHSRLVLLAPCLFIFFMLLWSPSVSADYDSLHEVTFDGICLGFMYRKLT